MTDENPLAIGVYCPTCFTRLDDIDGLVEENVRNGGHWFTLTHKGHHYEVQVTEVTQR